MTTDSLLEVEDQASIRKYFGIIPHLVWEIALTPLEVTLYAYFVRVAGEDGVCWQSTRTIAKRTGISVGTISAARKTLEAAGLISQGVQHRRIAGQDRYVIHVRILDNWLLNVGYFTKEEKYIQQVVILKSKIIDLRSPHEGSTCVQSIADLRSPGEPKKNPLKKNTKKEREVNTDAPNPESPSPADPERPTPLRGKARPPKRVLVGTGDPQRDHVDIAAAGTSAVSAKELVARAMYQVVKPDLEYPEGKTKAAKSARYPMEKAASDVLEQIGRTNYQEALHACHILITEPTPDETVWLDKVDKVGGIVGTVTKRVSQLRAAARSRAAAIERNKIALEQYGYPVYLDPDMDTDTIGIVGASIGVIVNVGPDVPHEYADIWRKAKEDLELSLARAVYDTYLRFAELQNVTESGTLIVSVNDEWTASWLEGQLKPMIKRTLDWIAGHPVEISFVARNGMEGGDGHQDED